MGFFFKTISKKMKNFSLFYVTMYKKVKNMSKVREPKQERAIQKKIKIIEAGYKLFSEVGYYNTNTAEIAKCAGVSTGIVYGYFKDKRDILFEVLDMYIDNVYQPILEYLDNLSKPLDIRKVVEDLLDESIKIHERFANIHEALHSLTPTDKKINDRFLELEDDITYKIADRFDKLDYHLDNKYEKIHFIMNIMQSFSHEYIFDSHKYIDYAKLRELVISTIHHVLIVDADKLTNEK